MILSLKFYHYAEKHGVVAKVDLVGVPREPVALAYKTPPLLGPTLYTTTPEICKRVPFFVAWADKNCIKKLALLKQGALAKEGLFGMLYLLYLQLGLELIVHRHRSRTLTALALIVHLF